MAETILKNRNNQMASIDNVANKSGGIAPGNILEPDVDEQLFKFNSDDTPLMNLMLKAKKVKVASPEVDHYMIDELSPFVTTIADYNSTVAQQTVLNIDSSEANIVRPFTTLLVRGVDGYLPDGKTKTPGKDLMLFVKGIDTVTNCPIVSAINGPKSSSSDEYCQIPSIPAGTKLIILANAMYETQKEVEPDLILPQPTRIYLQKRGMNQVVSDYFEAQRKRIPFGKAILAEQAISIFKTRGNRTLWAGRAGKFPINVEKMGMQHVYTTEGVRWQFKRELHHSGAWSIEQLIALAKMFFTGEDVPKSAILLAGKNLLEQLQKIDFSKHPEIQVTQTTLKTVGWDVTRIHTVFGDIDIKREPTLDRLGWSNSGGLIGEDRLVHYIFSQEHSFSDRVEGEEATRSGVLTWDALALKGTCHIWIDGEGDTPNPDSIQYVMWDKETAPAVTASKSSEAAYYLLTDCPAIDAKAKAGELWQYIVPEGETVGAWVEILQK